MPPRRLPDSAVYNCTLARFRLNRFLPLCTWGCRCVLGANLRCSHHGPCAVHRYETGDQHHYRPCADSESERGVRWVATPGRIAAQVESRPNRSPQSQLERLEAMMGSAAPRTPPLFSSLCAYTKGGSNRLCRSQWDTVAVD